MPSNPVFSICKPDDIYMSNTEIPIPPTTSQNDIQEQMKIYASREDYDEILKLVKVKY